MPLAIIKQSTSSMFVKTSPLVWSSQENIPMKLEYGHDKKDSSLPMASI